ncbi:MAG: phosphoribosylglycinamide formyltransferase [Caldilineaceae bacterium]|nr:phosphoribosylglycinamide formyltransferase [Caldilineaceae bacterium]
MSTRLAVLISGNGSNLQAILDAIRLRVVEAEVVVVIANRKDAYGLQRAAKAGIPTHYHPLKPYLTAEDGRTTYDAALAAFLAPYKVDWVVLAGWLHILSDTFLRQFPYRVINLHPALPGQFPGLQAIERAFAAYQAGLIKKTGVMVHLVPDEGVDSGPVLVTREVLIYPRDTLEQLEKRVHQAEHQALVEALQRLIEGDIT